jgi:hypothetical protein
MLQNRLLLQGFLICFERRRGPTLLSAIIPLPEQTSSIYDCAIAFAAFAYKEWFVLIIFKIL